MLRRLRRFSRAANAMTYGLLVGFLALAALSAVQITGRQAQQIFAEAGIGIAGGGFCPAGSVTAGGRSFTHPQLPHRGTIQVSAPADGAAPPPGASSWEYQATLRCQDGQVALEPGSLRQAALACTAPQLAVGGSCVSPVYQVTAYSAWSGPDTLPACQGTASQSRSVTSCANQLGPVATSLCSSVAVTSRTVVSVAGSTSCSPQPESSSGGTQSCAEGSTSRSACTGFSCSDGNPPVAGSCVRTATCTGMTYPSGSSCLSAPSGCSHRSSCIESTATNMATGTFVRNFMWDSGSDCGDDVCFSCSQVTAGQVYTTSDEPNIPWGPLGASRCASGRIICVNAGGYGCVLETGYCYCG